MPIPCLTIKDVLALGEGCFKFVKVGGAFRFHDIMECTAVYHSHMVLPGEKATAAGIIFVFPGQWTMQRDYSETLGISTSEADKVELTRLLGREEKAQLEG